MVHFDADFADGVLNRMRRRLPDATPKWGCLTRQKLPGHFIWILHHSMGRSTNTPDCSNWFLTHVRKPLFLAGIVSFPRNLTVPLSLGRQGGTLCESGDLQQLEQVMYEYLSLVQTGELQPAPHPFFGPLDVDEWDRLHVRHFEYHLKQFDL